MPYQAVTLAALQSDLAARVDNHPWWTPEQARLALNEGLRVWQAATAFWPAKGYVPCVPDDPYVPLIFPVASYNPVSGQQALAPGVRVLYNGRPLEKVSLSDLDLAVPNWRAATTATAGAPGRPVYWAPVALNLIAIYPAIDVSLFPATLEVAGVQATPLLVDPTDYVDLGEEQHDVLLGYALHALSFSIGGQRFTATYPGWLAFLRAAAAENRQLAATATFRRLLGLDQQRWLRRQERPAINAVDQALQADGDAVGGGA